MACQVFDPHRGQDQEAGVTDNLLEAPGPGGIVPADPLIASLKAPGGRRELQAAQDRGAFGCGLDQVAEMGTKGHAISGSAGTMPPGPGASSRLSVTPASEWGGGRSTGFA